MNLYDLHINPKSLYGYQNRWKIPGIAYDMAKKNPDVRNPKLEQAIMRDPERVYRYAFWVLKGRWHEAEPYIIQNPEWAYRYALTIIKDRWPEAEPYIMRDPEWAYLYAFWVLKGRWLEAEPYIMREPASACRYALDILKRRWASIGKPEAEDYIKRDKHWWDQYKLHFRIQS